MTPGRHRGQPSRRLLFAVSLAVVALVAVAILRAAPLWPSAPDVPGPAAPPPPATPCPAGFDLYGDQTGQVCVRAVPNR